MSSEAANPPLLIFKIFVSHQFYRIWSPPWRPCKWNPGNKMENVQQSFRFHQSTPNVQPLSLYWINCILNISQCSFKIGRTKTIYETIRDKPVAVVLKAWRRSCLFRFLFAAELNTWTDAIKVIYMRRLLKEGNEMAPVLTYLGERATFHWFIPVHSDMCAALLLFYLSSVCSGSQRKQKEEGKVKSQPFFIYIEIWPLFCSMCLPEGDEIDCGNSESSAGLDGHTKGNFWWQTTVN